MATLAESLLRCKVEGNIVSLPPISEGALENYPEVRKALLNAGATYKRNTFVFPDAAQPYIDRLVSGESVNIKKEFQFFATPQSVAKLLMEKLPVPENSDYNEKVLEPSAGDGALIRAFYDHIGRVVPVDCFELMDINRTKLEKIEGVNVLGDDFLYAVHNWVEKEDSIKGRYDIIIANPPFTGNQDIDHIEAMWECLKSGGTLVTLASPPWSIGSSRKQERFRGWLTEVNATIEEIPAGSFKESGTNIRTMLLLIQKHQEKTQEELLDAFVENVVTEETPTRETEVNTESVPTEEISGHETPALPSSQPTAREIEWEQALHFFQPLAQFGRVDVMIRIMEKNGKFTVSVLPNIGNANAILPVNATGTPEELDAELFKQLGPLLRDASQVAPVVAAEEPPKSAPAKPSASKAKAKPAPAKTAAKKPAAAPVKKAETPKKEVKPVAKPKYEVPTLF